jgi:hypothetical protein
MSARPSVCPHVTSRLRIHRFLWNLISKCILILWRENGSFVIFRKELWVLYVISSRLIILRMRNTSDKVAEKIKTQVSRSVTIFRKLCCLWDNVEYMVESEKSQMIIQYGAETVRFTSRIPQATNTHSEYVTLVFPTATTVARTLLHVTPIVHCLSCLYKKMSILRLSPYISDLGWGEQVRWWSVLKNRPLELHI